MKPSSLPSPASSPCRHSSLPDRAPVWRVLPGLLAAALLAASCREAKVSSYRIPKEHDPKPEPAVPAAAPKSGAGPMFALADAGDLTWTAPAAWQPKSGSAMRKGSYAVGDDHGSSADLAITAFPGDVGGDLANVNRWRGQLSLPPISASELPAALTGIAVGDLGLKLVELAGGNSEAPQRMLGAMVPYKGAIWFFKLTGPDAIVAREKANFLAFLRTIQPSPPASIEPATPTRPPAMAATPVSLAEGPGLKWSAPARWQEKPASAMRKATFAISGPNGSGEVAVTAFPGGVGGELANLNRWRGQLSLPPVGETELTAAAARLNVNGLTVTMVDLTGPGNDPQRLLGAMVPYAGATWFFKLTGPAALVADEKPAFLSFLQTLSAP